MACSSETSVDFQRTTCHIAEYRTFNSCIAYLQCSYSFGSRFNNTNPLVVADTIICLVYNLNT
jgi:hypothetical protein